MNKFQEAVLVEIDIWRQKNESEKVQNVSEAFPF
jgi:hypothetical protein